MNWRRLLPYFLWYSAVAAGLTLVALYAIAWWVGVPFEPVALAVFLASLVVGPVLLGTTDTGIEAASTSAEAGFGVGNPMDLQPDSLPVPGRAALVFYCLGLTVGGGAVLALSL